MNWSWSAFAALSSIAAIGSACLAAPPSFPCANDGTCPSGFDCLKGTCTEHLACGSVRSNRYHCGACGNACPGQLPCIDGECRCKGELTSCDGKCVDTTKDVQNCGRCGDVCATGEACNEGTCECSAKNSCNGTCTNLATDPKNCGSCGTKCSTGQGCAAGKCVTCPPGSLVCNGKCVPSDAKNCGTCGTTCATGSVCNEGACVCAKDPNKLFCNGACVDGWNDRKHCGACEKRCATGEVCTAGTCATAVGEGDYTTKLATDGTWVFVGETDRIVYLPVSGIGGAKEIAHRNATHLAVSTTDLVVVVSGNRILRFPLATGTPLTQSSTTRTFSDLAADDAAVWAISANGLVRVQGVTASPVLAFGSATPSDLRVQSGVPYWIEASTLWTLGVTAPLLAKRAVVQGFTPPYAIDATHAYGEGSGAGDITRWALDGSTTTVIASSASSPSILRVDSKHVYWSDRSRYALRRAPIQGGAVQDIFDDRNVGTANVPISDFLLVGNRVVWMTGSHIYSRAK